MPDPYPNSNHIPCLPTSPRLPDPTITIESLHLGGGKGGGGGHGTSGTGGKGGIGQGATLFQSAGTVMINIFRSSPPLLTKPSTLFKWLGFDPQLLNEHSIVFQTGPCHPSHGIEQDANWSGNAGPFDTPSRPTLFTAHPTILTRTQLLNIIEILKSHRPQLPGHPSDPRVQCQLTKPPGQSECAR
ncbi:hypothetical protein C8R45DRAFT_1073086 [Mycena sanguinolenta]|nr:hypothetical protein C8R45DRAFT_1073086 [Mycena sanguinolenta]